MEFGKIKKIHPAEWVVGSRRTKTCPSKPVSRLALKKWRQHLPQERRKILSLVEEGTDSQLEMQKTQPTCSSLKNKDGLSSSESLVTFAMLENGTMTTCTGVTKTSDCGSLNLTLQI
ncbi:unnamed protein product [Eretmochelys imbricata]